jgi:hypothetical protein
VIIPTLDFLASVESGAMDYIGIFAVTAGERNSGDLISATVFFISLLFTQPLNSFNFNSKG